jgi:hypothetical protein
MRNINFHLLGLAGVAGVLLGGQNTFAATNTVEIIASDNAWVRLAGGLGDTDMDEGQELKVRNKGFGNNGQSYLRFDVSDLDRLKTFDSASLKLHLITGTGWGNAVTLFALNDGYTNATLQSEMEWTSALTYNTAPAGEPSGSNPDTSSQLASHSADTSDVQISFNLNSSMAGLLASDTNNEITFILYCAIHTKEHEMTYASLGNTSTNNYIKPTLTVTGDFLPPAGTLIAVY